MRLGLPHNGNKVFRHTFMDALDSQWEVPSQDFYENVLYT